MLGELELEIIFTSQISSYKLGSSVASKHTNRQSVVIFFALFTSQNFYIRNEILGDFPVCDFATSYPKKSHHNDLS
jgi:hypothetical protein